MRSNNQSLMVTLYCSILCHYLAATFGELVPKLVNDGIEVRGFEAGEMRHYSMNYYWEMLGF